MTKITVAKGDGIGPEIMDAALSIILAAGANIEIEEIEVGEKVYLAGNTAGIAKESWDIVRKNKVFLKAPITTPIPAARRSGGTTSLTTAITSVPERPPKAPHRIRAASNAVWVCASAQANVPAVKPA